MNIFDFDNTEIEEGTSFEDMNKFEFDDDLDKKPKFDIGAEVEIQSGEYTDFFGIIKDITMNDNFQYIYEVDFGNGYTYKYTKNQLRVSEDLVFDKVAYEKYISVYLTAEFDEYGKPRYLTEDAQNKLPRWEDSILPFSGYNMTEYEKENNTLLYIVKNHTRIPRIRELLDLGESGKAVRDKFNLSVSDFKIMKDKIRDKIHNGYSFNEEQTKIINYILYGKNSQGKYINLNDMFPEDVTTAKQVREIVETAYRKARLLGKSQTSIERTKDMENRISDFAVLYQGVARGLIIHFWFDFWNYTITTAYPVSKESSIRKYK